MKRCKLCRRPLLPIAFTILGAVYSLKNSKTLTTRGGRVRTIKNWKARRFQETFCQQVPVQYRNLGIGSREKPLRGTITVFYPSYRQDVDVEAVWDLLQVSGVVKNDRYIREKHIYGFVDGNRPRVEIRLEEIQECVN